MSKAKNEYKEARANLGGVGFACFLTSREQDDAFNKAFKRLALAAQSYVPELEAEIERLRAIEQEGRT